MRALPAALFGTTVAVGLALTATPASAGIFDFPSPFASSSSSASTAPNPFSSSSSSASTAPNPFSSSSSSSSPASSGSGSPSPGASTVSPAWKGVFERTPATGPAGTSIDVKSVTACPSYGKVEVVLFSAKALDDENAKPAVDQVMPTDMSGHWYTTLKVPAKAEVGEQFVILAGCYGPETVVGPDTEPVAVYETQDYVVTGEGTVEAPPAVPVVQTPSFTG